LLQRGDLVHHVALEYRRVVPGEILEGRGHVVLRQAVQPVGQLAAARRPPGGEPLVAPPAQQQSLGAERLVERELVELGQVLDQADPAAAPEVLVAGRSSITPSSETFSLTNIVPISALPSLRCQLPAQPAGVVVNKRRSLFADNACLSLETGGLEPARG
jgi:hypothetical protein